MRKNYDKLQSDITEDLDVHHIDWNKKNDNIDNLIVIPLKIRELVHEQLGYVNREELTVLTTKFNSKRNYRKMSTALLNAKLSKYVNTSKGCELSIHCVDNLGKIKRPRRKNVNSNYRKACSEEYGEIPKGWEVHHIDWNHDNNEVINLIALPKNLHELVHKYLGYVNREELVVVVEVYKKSNFPISISLDALNIKLSKYIDTNKGCELSTHCKGRMDFENISFLNAFDWRDGNRGLI